MGDTSANDGILLLLWHAGCYESLLNFCFLQVLRWNFTHHPILLEVCWQGWSINGFLLQSWPFFFFWKIIQAQNKGPSLYIYILRYSVYVLCIMFMTWIIHYDVTDSCKGMTLWRPRGKHGAGSNFSLSWSHSTWVVSILPQIYKNYTAGN